MSFNHLQLIEPLLKAISEQGYTQPTPVQEQAIPIVLNRKDLLGCAQTGTGKTAAFAIPLLQHMHFRKKNDSPGTRRVIRTLVLTPTRELAIQIGESFQAYGRHLDQRALVIFGGVPQRQQVMGLREGTDTLIATPGRLLDLLSQRLVTLNNIEFFVLDEADRMLDMGFVHDVKRIISKLPTEKQTLFFSATMPPAIQQLASMLLRNPEKVEVTPPSTTVDLIQQSLYYVEKQNKRSLLIHLLKNGDIRSALVFTRTKYGADRVARDLKKAGLRAEAIHGDKTQNARQAALQNFKSGRTVILVATDIAARGLDIEELSHVLNFELPNIPETYVHRIGRTGRAGASGSAISFCDFEEKLFLSDIQRSIRKTIPVVKGHPFDAPLMHATEQAAPQQQAASFSRGRKAGGGRRYGKVFSQRA